MSDHARPLCVDIDPVVLLCHVTAQILSPSLLCPRCYRLSSLRRMCQPFAMLFAPLVLQEKASCWHCFLHLLC